MRRVATIIVVVFFAAFVTSSVFAHNETINTSFDGLCEPNSQLYNHIDEDPFKGSFTVNATNTGSEPWGNFHFKIVSIGWDVSNVDFMVDPPNQPSSSQSPLSWNLNHNKPEMTLHLMFYDDPVAPTESATFTVYTDNTTDQVSFGVMIYPTPIPEPATITLFGFGISVLLGKRRKLLRC